MSLPLPEASWNWRGKEAGSAIEEGAEFGGLAVDGGAGGGRGPCRR